MAKLNKAQKWEKIARMLLTAHEDGNTAAMNESYFIEAGVSAECFSEWSGKMAGMWIAFKDYQQALRNAACKNADELPEKTRKELQKPVWAVWSEVCHNLGLRCHKDDIKMIWRTIENIVTGAEDKKVVGTKKPYQFRKGIEIELGLRLAEEKSKTPEELAYEIEKKAAQRRVKSCENRVTTSNTNLKVLQGILEKVKGTPGEEDIQAMVDEAEELAKKAASDLEKARNREKAITLESVTASIAAEIAGKAESTEKKEEVEEKAEAPEEEKK